MPASKVLSLGRDNNGYLNDYFAERPFSTLTIRVSLLASTAHAFTIPLQVTTVRFDYSHKTPVDVWVGLNAVPVAPTDSRNILLEDGDAILLEDGDNLLLEGDGSAGSGIALNPWLMTVRPGDVLTLICVDATELCITYYARNQIYS